MRVNTDTLEGARYDEMYSAWFNAISTRNLYLSRRPLHKPKSSSWSWKPALNRKKPWPEPDSILLRAGWVKEEEMERWGKGEEEMHHTCKCIRLAEWCIYSRYSRNIEFYFHCSKPQSSANVPLTLMKAINNQPMQMNCFAGRATLLWSPYIKEWFWH